MKKLMMMAMAAATMVGAAKAENVAVAVKSTDEKTLTFYYMDAAQTNALPGTVYVVPEYAAIYTDLPWYVEDDNPITNVVFDATFAGYRPTATTYWFYFFKALTGITDIQNLNTSSVTNMNSMFQTCDALAALDVSGFNTANVTTMSCMFYGCEALTKLDVSGFDTANVTKMAYMFYGCKALTALDLSGFDTAKVTNMGSMFNGCAAFTELDLSGFDTANVTTMVYMFKNCSSLTALDLSGFDTAKVTKMTGMFSGSSKLTTIYVSDAFKTDQVTSSSDMFKDCNALKGSKGTAWAAANPTDKTYARIDNPPNAPGYFTTLPLTFTAEEEDSTVTFKWASGSDVMINTNGAWVAYSKNTTIALAKVGDKVMFKGNGVTTDGGNRFKMTGKIAASGDVGTLTDGKGGADVTLTEKCYTSMFASCTSLTTAPTLPAETIASECYNGMFKGCTSLTAAPVLPATNLASTCYASMFSGCTSLTTAPTLPAETTATYCYYAMFQGCTSLTAVPNLPAKELAKNCYYYMFHSCSSLKVNQEEPGTEWLMPAENEAENWSTRMFECTPGTIPSAPSTNVTYYVVPTVAFTPIEVENATWEIIEDNGVWPLRDKVHTNATIKVRYTAKDGLAFADGSYVKTVLVGKADADPFAPTGYAPAAPQEWTQATASTTVDIDTRTDKTYFDADDILPIWVPKGWNGYATNTWMVAEKKIIFSYNFTTTTNCYGWKPAYLGKYELMLELGANPVFGPEAITYTTPVYVSTNAALDVEGTTWALVDAGGSPITEMDDQGRFKVPTNSQLKVVYTPTKDGYYFKDGTKTYEAAFTATGAEYFDAATMIAGQQPKAGDIGQPKVQLGVVAQRYPWDGKIDVQYKALYTPAETYKLKVTVTVDGVAKDATTEGFITSGISTYVYDVRADFGEVKTKNCKVTAKLVSE